MRTLQKKLRQASPLHELASVEQHNCVQIQWHFCQLRDLMPFISGESFVTSLQDLQKIFDVAKNGN